LRREFLPKAQKLYELDVRRDSEFLCVALLVEQLNTISLAHVGTDVQQSTRIQMTASHVVPLRQLSLFFKKCHKDSNLKQFLLFLPQ